MQRGEYAAALEHFKQAIRLDAHFVDAYLQIGGHYLEMGQLKDSIK
jgi:tetratricopeptide (TPR) repeat protein